MADNATDPAIEARAERRVEEIGAELAADVVPITDAMHAELLERIPELDGDPVIIDLFYASTQANLAAVAHLVQGHVPIENVDVPTPASEYARRLAQRGVRLEALLRAYRLGQRRFLEWAFDRLARLEADPAVRFAAARIMNGTTFEYVDRIAEGIVAAYQIERETWLASRNTVRAEVLNSVLAGQGLDLSVAESGLGHRLRQHHLGLVLWHRDTGTTTPELRDLERAAGAVSRCAGAQGAPLFVSRDHATAWAWLAMGTTDAAPDPGTVTAAVATDHPDVMVALGTVQSSEAGFRATHLEALKAHQVAMVGQDHAPVVTSYDDGGVRAAALLASDLDGTRRMVATTLGDLADGSENAARLRETLLTFLRCNDSYVATADQVHLHKNTVKYRVDKAIAARGKPLDVDRLDLELALIACEWLTPAVLRPAD